jgi:hypothetical protein
MKNKILLILMIIFVVSFFVPGCAKSPYTSIEEKRLNQVMIEANESYALGMYATAARKYGKTVQFAVIQQEHLILAQAQYKLALSFERSFQNQFAVSKVWQQARHYSEKYNYEPFKVMLGWFNWSINHYDMGDKELMTQQLEHFQEKYPPGNTSEKVQLFNLIAKWHLSNKDWEKANSFLNQAMLLLNGSELEQGFALTSFNKAMVLAFQGEFNNSLELLQKSLPLDSRNNNISGVYANLKAQAKILDILGKHDQAEVIREQSRNTRNYIMNKLP